RNPQRALGVLKSLLATAATQSEQIENAPPALRATLLFPYDEGRTWAMEIYTRGGWEALSAAYKDLPQSTEQILHSEKYLSREAPVKINLPDVSAALGPQWKKIEYDVNGEWGYYLILGQYLTGDDEAAKKAASGWGGDRYALYEHPATGRLCVVHLSAWDTEQDAREFFDAYARRIKLKAGAAAGTPNPAGTTTGAEGEFSFAGKEGAVEMRRRGSRVLVVEGLDEKRKATIVELLKKSL
ncbi:MAG TPA: hypothetical protein VM870_04090, partial [Pyrinomonadaceae bacterium]|nr:hypothetical protein [Pyrinomonadaceae bacterium]